MKFRFIYILSLIGLLWFLSGCASSSAPTPAEGKKINIVAAENFYGEVAKTVGGDNVNVRSILNERIMDPEDFSPTPQDAREVAGASIVIYNGIGYDAWMEKLLSASKENNRREIAVATDLLKLNKGDNPHVWYNLEMMRKLALSLADELAKMDPQNAQTYQQNAQNYVKKLDALIGKETALIQSAPIPIETTETIFEYMAKKLNFAVQTPGFAQAIFNGVDPTPGELISIEKNIKNKKIKLLIYNKNTKSQEVDRLTRLAKENGVPIVSVTEQKPANTTYISWMTDVLNKLEEALNGN